MAISRMSTGSAPFEFDWQQLKQLAGEDAAFENELLQMFLQDARSSLEKLEKAIATRRIQAVEDTAHSLRGASANVGALALAATARRLEELARSGQLDEAKALLQVMNSHCERIQISLRSRLKEGE